MLCAGVVARSGPAEIDEHAAIEFGIGENEEAGFTFQAVCDKVCLSGSDSISCLIKRETGGSPVNGECKARNVTEQPGRRPWIWIRKSGDLPAKNGVGRTHRPRVTGRNR